MAHRYFASMGGFAFDCDFDNGGEEFIPGSPSLRYTSHAILLLAKLDRLPNISTADISDKSKADGLAKTLVCLQASWMLLQCIGRIASNLPITLLEINTIGHCFCALVIYLIWWNKPLHVLEPIVLTGDWMRGFTSYAYMGSSMLTERFMDISNIWADRVPSKRKDVVFKTELARLQFIDWEEDQKRLPGSMSQLS